MKKLYFLFALSTATTFAQAPFVTTWEADSFDLSITVPTLETLTYDYTIDFGDGTILNNVTGDPTHSYATFGLKTVSISGNFPAIYFNGDFDIANSIQSVEQWGDIQWATMNSAFEGCENLTINATDAPDLSQVTDLSGMFRNAYDFNQPINHWDVSSVTDMSGMFREAGSFNQPLNDWDVSSVTDMSGMFEGDSYLGTAFSQPLDNWDVSSVTDMSEMFEGDPSLGSYFSQPLDNWDVSSVTDMSGMFGYAFLFDQPLDNWDVSNVVQMAGMFYDADFNQDISTWDFNPSVDFSAGTIPGFVADSGLDVSNYDALLGRFVELGLLNKTFPAQELLYCDEASHNELTDNLGWEISGDSLSDDCRLALAENDLHEFIEIHPVPATDVLHLEIPVGISVNLIEVFDAQGKKIITVSDGFGEINVANLAAGHYFMKIHPGQTTLVKRFIKL